MRVSLYKGRDRWQEQLAGTLDGESVEASRLGSVSYPGRLVDGRRVVIGRHASEIEVGKIDEDRRTILRTATSGRYEPVGEVDPDGVVYLGTGPRRERAGRVEPPHAGAAACLALLLLLDNAPAGSGRSRYGSTPPPSRPSDARQHGGGESIARGAGGVAGALLGAGVIAAAKKLAASPRVAEPAHIPQPSGSVHVTLSDAEIEQVLARGAYLGVSADGPEGLRVAWRKQGLSHTGLLLYLWGTLCRRIAAYGRRSEQMVGFPKGWLTGGWRVVPTEPYELPSRSADITEQLVQRLVRVGLSRQGRNGVVALWRDRGWSIDQALNVLWVQFCCAVALEGGENPRDLLESGAVPQCPVAWSTGGWLVIPGK